MVYRLEKSFTNGHLQAVSRPLHTQPQNSQPAHAPTHPSNDDDPANASTDIVVVSQRNQRAPYLPAPELDKDMPPTPPAQVVLVPSSVKRYSLVDKPVLSPPISPPAVIIEEPSADRDDANGADVSPPQTPSNEAPETPAVASSLAALKKSDVLERRASKRFSSYHIGKLTHGAISRERSIPGSPNRRSMAASSSLTPGDLAVLTEVDEPEVKRDGSTPKKRTPSPAGVDSRRLSLHYHPRLPTRCDHSP
jgi:hypothetical protein